MEFLTFWIASTIITFCVALICQVASGHELMRMGYIKSNAKYHWTEYAKSFMLFMIPYLNILLAILFLFCSKKLRQTLIENKYYIKNDYDLK